MIILQIIRLISIISFTFIIFLGLYAAIESIPKNIKDKNYELIYTNTVKIITTLYILGIIYYIAILIK